jgi:hypothetical protein
VRAPVDPAETSGRLRKPTAEAGSSTPLDPVCDGYDAAHHPVTAQPALDPRRSAHFIAETRLREALFSTFSHRWTVFVVEIRTVVAVVPTAERRTGLPHAPAEPNGLTYIRSIAKPARFLATDQNHRLNRQTISRRRTAATREITCAIREVCCHLRVGRVPCSGSRGS